MLELYAEGKLLSTTANASYLAVTGFTESGLASSVCRSLGYYAQVDEDAANEFTHNTRLPYESSSFQLITWLRPPSPLTLTPTNSTSSSSSSLSMNEVVRVLGSDGVALIGATEEVWVNESMMEKLEQLEAEGVEIMSLQRLDLNAPPTNDNMATLHEPHEDHVTAPYFLGVLKRTM